ncbi:MAG: hypothetical protein JW860_09805 [Sedimentisphaerales bacterium]|nr:hypothetical protein [Sedimentisphaerales bacterium]
MKYVLGIDAGSSYIKLVLIDEQQKTVARNIIKRGADIDASCRESYNTLLNTSPIDKNDINGIMATGYGRKQVTFCNEVITEITALSVGGFTVAPDVRTIIDIGGQDSKVIAVDTSGKVVDFVMNHKCSAGTGKFLEVTSASLGVTIEDLGRLSQAADTRLRLSSTCTVFAESEIVSYIARGVKKENIIKALHAAISGQIVGLFHQVNSVDDGKILLAGGVALNEGLVHELSGWLNREVLVPEYPQYTGAYGAAIYLQRKRKDRKTD